jgi:hypothetical protein
MKVFSLQYSTRRAHREDCVGKLRRFDLRQAVVMTEAAGARRVEY